MKMIEELLTSIDDKLGILIEQNQTPHVTTSVEALVEEDDLIGDTKSKKPVLDDVLAAINDNVKRIGGDDAAKVKVRKVLEKHGAKRGSEVKEEDFVAVIEALGKLKK